MIRFLAIAILFSLATSACGADTAVLIKGLASEDASEKRKAAESLAASTDDSDAVATALCMATYDTDTENVVAVLAAMEKLRPKLYKAFVGIALEKRLQSKLKSIDAVASLGMQGKPAFQAILLIATKIENKSYIPHKNASYSAKELSEFQPAVFAALIKMGIPDEESAKVFADFAINAKVGNVKGLATMALTDWGKRTSGSEKIVFPVIHHYLSKDSNMVFTACNMLVEYGDLAKKEFGPTLVKLKQSTNIEIRKWSSSALEKLDR